MKSVIAVALLGVMVVAGGCTRHHVTADTTHRVEIAPIHVTVVINLKVHKDHDDD